MVSVQQGSRPIRIVAAILSAAGWFALALQLRLILGVNAQTGVAIGETFVRFFSYFTILTNVLAALVLTGVTLGHRGTFLSRPAVQTAVASYITIVGLVYVTILRHLWMPAGPQWLADALLHYAMPALYVLFWLLFAQKEKLRFRDSLWWLAFPLGYVAFVLLRGAPSGFYPYPFIDVSQLGYPQVFLNAAGLFAVFALCGLIYVALSRRLAKETRDGPV
jgi:hypothetical protein